MTTARGDYPGARWLPNTPDGPTVAGLAAGDHARCGASRYVCLDATDGSARWREMREDSRKRVFNYDLPEGAAADMTAVGKSITVAGTTTMYVTEIDLRGWKTVTNVNLLQGTTVGTDNARAVIYDADGNYLAASAAIGDATSGADTFLQMELTLGGPLVLPEGRHFVGIQLDGTTDQIQVLDGGADQLLLCEAETGHTFGELATDLTSAPTTVTTETACIVFLD